MTHVIRFQGLYWRPDRCGYTSNLLEAGLYTEAEAVSQARRNRGDEAVELAPLLAEYARSTRFNDELLKAFFAERFGPAEEERRHAAEEDVAEAQRVMGLRP